MTDIKLPSLAEGVNKASVSYWHKKIGDDVKQGEDIVELITDKATFNMPSPVAGKLKEILVQEGDEAAVGQVIAKIE